MKSKIRPALIWCAYCSTLKLLRQVLMIVKNSTSSQFRELLSSHHRIPFCFAGDVLSTYLLKMNLFNCITNVICMKTSHIQYIMYIQVSDSLWSVHIIFFGLFQFNDLIFCKIRYVENPEFSRIFGY